MINIRKVMGPGLGLAGLLTLALVPAEAQQLGIATMAQGTASYTTGAAIATVLQANGVNAAPAPGTGETEVNALVNDDEVALGISSILEVINAYTGEGAYAGNPQTEIRILAALAPLKVAFFVRASSNIQTLADLRGRRVTTEFTGLGTIDQVAQAVLANAGLTKADIVGRPVANVAVGAAEFEAGNVDAFFFAIGTPAVQAADANVGGLRMLPLDPSPEAVARMEAVFPEGSLFMQPPTPAQRGFTEPSGVILYDNLLLISTSASDELAGQIASIIAGNKEALVAIHPSFNDLDPAQMYKPDLPVPYHPGAVQHYEQAGLAAGGAPPAP